jgi:raffinose/stachyose/melibiose transport system substrate-binding protein
MKLRALAFAAIASTCLAGLTPASAQTLVRWLHVETNPGVVAIWERAARDFEAKTPGVKIEMRVMEVEAARTRINTILQSDTRPNIVYARAGGELETLIRTGNAEDITSAIMSGWQNTVSPASIGPFSRNGRVFAVPYIFGDFGFWLNKDLMAKAGVKKDDLANWPGFIDAVKKFKAAGITPITMGSQDKWPIAVLHSAVAHRVAGQPAIDAAMAGDGSGLAGPDFLRAAQLFKELTDLQPFNEGHVATRHMPSQGVFADGKAAMNFNGSWYFRLNGPTATDKKGLDVAQVDWIPFPLVPGGKGTLDETQALIAGWAVTKGSPPQTVEFLKHLISYPYMKDINAGGFQITVVNGTANDIQNPLVKSIAERLAAKKTMTPFWHDAGPGLVGAFSDATINISLGTATPQQAVSATAEAWKKDLANR